MSSFEDQLALCDPGDEIVYHKGFHCMKEFLNKDPVKNDQAKAAWKAYERGDVLLYQRRIAPDLLHYCAKVIR